MQSGQRSAWSSQPEELEQRREGMLGDCVGAAIHISTLQSAGGLVTQKMPTIIATCGFHQLGSLR